MSSLIRVFVFLLLVFIIPFDVWAQQYDYTVPGGFEDKISQSDYRTIADMALPLIAKRYKILLLEKGSVTVEQEGAKEMVFYLDNLVSKCVEEKNKNNWSGIVQAHFNSIFAAADEEKRISQADIKEIRPYLSLRIYPESYITDRGGMESVIARRDLDGTYTLLMLDLSTAFRTVGPEEFARWKIDTAAAFRMAQENINQQKVDKVTEQFDVPKGGKIKISMVGDDNYTASYILDIEHNSPDLVGGWGTVLAVPNKGLAVMCKVSKENPVDFVQFINITKAITEKAYKESPYPVSPDYFWYYKGKFTKIQVTVSDKGGVNVVAPAAMAELMTVKE